MFDGFISRRPVIERQGSDRIRFSVVLAGSGRSAAGFYALCEASPSGRMRSHMRVSAFFFERMPLSLTSTNEPGNVIPSVVGHKRCSQPDEQSVAQSINE